MHVAVKHTVKERTMNDFQRAVMKSSTDNGRKGQRSHLTSVHMTDRVS